MTYFTDSPYERMMQEVPRTRRETEVPPVVPSNKPCKAYRYNRRVCVRALCAHKNVKPKRYNWMDILPNNERTHPVLVFKSPVQLEVQFCWRLSEEQLNQGSSKAALLNF